MRGNFRIEAGLLTRKRVRNFLQKIIFLGVNISFIEEKYLLESEFIVKGEREDIEEIMRFLSDKLHQ